MTDSIDVSPLGKVGRRYIAMARTAAAVIGVLATAVIGAITAYRVATTDTQVRVQATKDKAEAGYQVLKETAGLQDKRIADLEAVVHQLAAQQHPPARRGSRPRPIAAAPRPVPPRALPGDLDKAQKQVYVSASPGPATPAPKDATP